MEPGIERNSDSFVRLVLNRKWAIGIASAMAVILVFFISMSVYLFRGYQEVRHSQQVVFENAMLRDRILVLNSELDSIMIKLDLMENWEDDIRSRENYREINKEVRDMGIGGLPQIDKEILLTDQAFQLEYSMLTTRLTHLRAKAYFDYETHKELYDNVNLREDLYNSTPSIYPTFGRLSDAYGYRIHPITGKRTFHNGIDLSNKKGTPIYTTANGEVISVGYKTKLGKYIKIKHKFGFVTVYGHLSKSIVKKGDKLSKGTIIGEMGSTGKSTGSHLHYEVIRYNRNRNPNKYLVQERRDIALK